MTYKQIEASREMRLWIEQVIVPAAAAVIAIASNPQARNYISEKYRNAKSCVQQKFERR